MKNLGTAAKVLKEAPGAIAKAGKNAFKKLSGFASGLFKGGKKTAEAVIEEVVESKPLMKFNLQFFGGKKGAKELTEQAGKRGNDLVEGAVKGADNLPTVYDPDFAARQILDSPTNVTPGGRTITAHAAERMVTPPAGRVPTSIAEVDEFLDTATSIKKVTPHPLGDTITLRNVNSPIKEVVVDAATGKRIITVITPKMK